MQTSRVCAVWSGAGKWVGLALTAVLLLAGRPAGANDVWLGFGIGQVDPEGVNATVGFGGSLRVEFGDHFAIQPDLGYWKRTETTSGISVSASDFSFGVTALGLIPVRPVRFFVGGGTAVHHISGNVDSFGFSVSSDSLTKVGLAALGGMDIHISRSFVFFVAARYDWVPVDEAEAGNMNQRKLYGGFRLEL